MPDEPHLTQDDQPPPQQTPPPSSPTTPPPTETPPTTTTSTPSTAEKSLLNKEPATGAPEAYADFKVPEGYALDAEVAKEASTLFKEANLSQDQAQKLVDFYTKHTNEAFEQPYKAYKDMREGWVEQAKAHPEIGRDLNRVLITVAKAIDGVGDAALASEFRQVMDMTGAGDHPSFIRMFYKLAQKLTEGQPVTGNGPSRASQQSPTGRPATAAQALYPNLPSGA